MSHHRYGYKFKSNWEELNLKNLLDDASRLDVDQLARRYQINRTTVLCYLKKYSVAPKNPRTGGSQRKGEFLGRWSNIPDLSTAIGTIFPKHLY